MPSPRRTGRRAIGALLVVILSMIVVLSIIGMGQRFLGSAVTNQTQKASVGDLSLELAESALEEALHQFRIKANTPGSTVYELLRKDRYGDEVGAVPLSNFIDVPNLRKILDEPFYRKFVLRDLTADVVYQRQFEHLPYERFGLLKLRAQVRFDLSLTESVSREVEMGVGFKVALVGPPRPFDQPGFLLIVPETAPASLEFAELDSKKRDYTAMVKETHDDAKQRAESGNTPDAVKDEYREIPTLVQPSEVWQERLKDLPTERFLLMAGRPPPQPLEIPDLFIVKKLEEKEKAELTPARREVEAALRRVTTAPDDIDAHRALITAYRKRARALATLLAMMAEHRQIFDAKVGEIYDEVLRHRYKLSEQHWAYKPFFTVEDKPGDPIDAQLARLFRIQPLSGILKINSAQPVNLVNLDIAGRLIIVVGKGGVRLSNVNRRERPNDLLTVVSIGGPISVDGEVHAVILGGERASFSASPGATIHGGVVLDSTPSPADRQFRIVREQKYFSGTTNEKSPAGAYADYYYVATSPRFVYKKVRR